MDQSVVPRPNRRRRFPRRLKATVPSPQSDGKPIQARPVPAWYRAAKWTRRRPVHAALVAVLGTVLLTSLGGLEWARAWEKRHRDALQVVLDRSRRSEEEARDQRALADRQRGLAHRHWAASQLKLASSLCERGDQGAARSILDALGPSPGLPESRGFAWQFLDRLCPRLEMLAPLP